MTLSPVGIGHVQEPPTTSPLSLASECLGCGNIDFLKQYTSIISGLWEYRPITVVFKLSPLIQPHIPSTAKQKRMITALTSYWVYVIFLKYKGGLFEAGDCYFWLSGSAFIRGWAGVDPESLESEGWDPKSGKRGPVNGIWTIISVFFL